MNKKRLLTGILALTMLATTTLTSCSKKEPEIPMSKRTNVYSGESIKIPEGIDYIERMDTKGDNVYITYSTTYTITINDSGEEVERRKGYFWNDDASYDYDGEGIVITEETEEEVETEAETEENITDADGDGIADVEVEVPAEETTSSLPNGWYYEYTTVSSVTRINLESGETTTFDIPAYDEGYMNSMAIDANGNIAAIYYQYEWNEETSVGTQKYNLVQVDSNGSIISGTNINDMFGQAGIDDENTYIGSFVVDDNGNYYMTCGNMYIVLDSNLNFKEKFELEADSWINELSVDGDRVYVSYYGNGKQGIIYVENGQKFECGENASSVQNNLYYILGFKDNKMYYRTTGSVSVYDVVNDTISVEMDFINSDIQQNDISGMKLLSDGRILMSAYSSEYDDRRTELQIMTRVPDEQLQEEIIVTVGSLSSNYNLINAIIGYNKQNTGVRVALTTYNQYNNEENEYKGGINKFNNDIITGNIPDIVMLTSSMPVESYFKKGVFADLNQFMDDPEIGLDRSKYLSNVLDACTVDGKLCSIITSFSIRTLMGKTEFVGSEPGWTFEEMMQVVNNMPDGMKLFFDEGREAVINTFFRYAMSSFINWETGETYFETQGFIDFIKYLATCSEKGYWEEYYDTMDSGQYTYDAELEQEMQQNYDMRFYKNLGLLEFTTLSGFTDMYYRQNGFATTEITAIGYPTSSGSGSVIYPNNEFAISNTSQVQKQAWDVLKYFMNDEGLAKRSYYFSVNAEHLETLAENAANESYFYERTEEDYEWYKQQGYSEEYINYMRNSNLPFDKSIVDKTLDIIKGANVVSRSDDDLLEIINEELSGFFGGTKTAEETAKVIASRAKIYISEHS